MHFFKSQHNGILKVGCRNIVLVLFMFVIKGVQGLDSTEFQKNLPAKVVWGVIGKDVELPCDVTPPLPSDAVSMVFWFKDSTGMPLYSLDARGGPLDKAAHLTMTDGLGLRSYFITDEQPSKARLRIQNVNTEDEGVFRCRVDFLNSPTRNFRVNLTLVVQPSVPRIFNAEGREVTSSAGPYLEGQELFLSCQVTGGRPRPSLTWWYNNTILDSVVDTAREAFTTVNQLVITSVPRSLWGARLECRASSSEIAGDVTREIAITVYLKPSKVKIVTPNDLLSVHKTQTCKCETSGSYPPARLTWLLNGRPIRNALVTEEETESFSSSILSLEVTAEDDGKDLVCRADNPRFPGGYAEDRRQIHVAYPPKVVVKLDSGVPSPTKEGMDVVLRCDSLARPSPNSYGWYHDGHLVAYNETAGVLPIDHILTLRNVSRSAEGQYSCSAINSEGETYSAPYNLNVQYSPRCKKGHEVMRVAALPDESLVVHCHVDAIPEVVRFSWTYNTSKGVLPVQGARMQNNEGVSTLHFTPGISDLESLACWASNDVGRQETPCLFYIVPANKPETPKNCLIRNSTNAVLEVACIAGRDGGLQQSFVLEVSDITIPAVSPGVTTLSDQGEHSVPLYRVLGETPHFRLHSLEPDREYQLLVFAVNAKGRSEPPVVLSNIRVAVPVDTLQENESTTPKTDGGSVSPSPAPSRQNLTLILVSLSALAVLLIVGIVAVATVLACRRQPTTQVVRRPKRSKRTDETELSEAGFGEGFQRRSAQYRASLYAQELDERRLSRQIQGPDLILAPVSFSPQSFEY